MATVAASAPGQRARQGTRRLGTVQKITQRIANRIINPARKLAT